jgi:Domain of unknown function (DUF1707)
VSDDRLPAEAERPISEDLRQCAIDAVQGLVTSGKVDLDEFQTALERLLSARTYADVVAVFRSLPPPVELTPPARRRQEPLEISTSMGEVSLNGRWQVGRLTKIETGMGAVTIDLTEAEFDDWEVEIVVHAKMGSITVVAPRGLEVRPVGKSGPASSTLGPPVPGFPVVRLSASSDMGTIRLMHPQEPQEKRKRGRRRFRRSQNATPPY